VYAIIEVQGKQYRVQPGDSILVDRMEVPVGERLELDRVLLVANSDGAHLDPAELSATRVVATARGEVRGPKIDVLKFKRKVRYARHIGHRQTYTRLTIREILVAPAEAPAEILVAPVEGSAEESDGA